MNERETALVKKSWKIIGKINPVLVGDVFYSKLFLDTPELKSMFKTSRDEQSRKLMTMLTMIVAGLDRLDELKENIRQLSIRHQHYGVENWHYDKVGTALLWTLEHALGNDYNEETKQAWIQCYSELSAAMKQVVE